MLKRILPILLLTLIIFTVPASAADENYFIATMNYEEIFIHVEIVNDKATITIKSDEEDIHTVNDVSGPKIIKDFIRIFSVVDAEEHLEDSNNYVELEYSYKGENEAFINQDITRKQAEKIYDKTMTMANASIFVDVIKIMTVTVSVFATVILLVCASKSKNTSNTKSDNAEKNVETEKTE